jgi:hypothetical protein
MTSFAMVHDYKKNDDLRKSFNELAQRIFGIDFEVWYQGDYWNDNYICYSYTDHGRVIANVSVNTLQLVVNGQRINALQIGTVMTHPDYPTIAQA